MLEGGETEFHPYYVKIQDTVYCLRTLINEFFWIICDKSVTEELDIKTSISDNEENLQSIVKSVIE